MKREGQLLFCSAGDKPARWECLSPESLVKLLRLQKYIQDQNWSQLRLGLFDAKPKCTGSSSTCRETWTEYAREGGSLSPRVQERDIFRQLRVLYVKLNHGFEICIGCSDIYLAKVEEIRETIWEGFGEICLSGLGGGTSTSEIWGGGL